MRRRRADPVLPVVMNSSSHPPRMSSFHVDRRNRNRQSSPLLKVIAFIISLSSFFFIIAWLYPNNNHARDVMDPYKYDTQFEQQRSRSQTFEDARREREQQRAKRERERQQQQDRRAERRNREKNEKMSRNAAEYRYDQRKDHQRRQDLNYRKDKKDYRQNSIPGGKNVEIEDLFSKPEKVVMPTPSPTSKPTLTPTAKPVSSSQMVKNEVKKSGETITCPDQITVGVFDDDYCDCPDGSDEPNTSACSNILVQKLSFRCLDGNLQIHASRVNDGIKDCSDGSDEYLANVVVS